MAEFTAEGAKVLQTAMEEARALHARGLHNGVIIGGSEPKVTPKDKYILLPDYIDDTGQHGYGKLADLIHYLRQVNGIPFEAKEEIFVERDIGGGRKSVRFTWWQIETVLPIERGVT